MGKLSIAKYAGLCVVGGFIAYAACFLFGFTLDGSAADLHLAIFSMLPGFSALDATSFFFGAISVALWSAVGGAYIAWMHNVSIKN